MTRQRVTDHGPARKYWTQVPNLIDDSDLDPYARTLYMHYLRIAGQRETCEETVRQSASICKMSQSSVLKARQALVDGRWIEVEDVGTHGRGSDQRLHILDRWAENMAHFSQATDDDLNARVASISAPGDDLKCSPRERNARVASNSDGNARVASIPLHHASISISDIFLKNEKGVTEEIEKKGVAHAREPRPVDDAFLESLETEFAPALGSREAVRDKIAAALSHKARFKYSDQRAYLRNWLRRDVERMPIRRNGHDPPSAEHQRAREEMERTFGHLLKGTA